ncbi:MAG TPA: pyridoxal phosphate-dependent aminotransferase [Candidatus Micrarchaeaceae archaeon]|nr:pyridoxal phosphate-dependent aminotransferase [Candidatus Micrarchaeaceae archaeon]
MTRRPESKPAKRGSQRAPSALVAALAQVGSLDVAAQFEAHPEWPRLPLRSYPWVDHPPEHVVAAAAAAARAPESVPTLGFQALRVSLAHELGTAVGARVDVDEIAVTNGAMGALSVLWSALLEPGDQVLVPAPNYYVEGSIILAGGRFRPVQAVESDRTDWERIERSITTATKVLFLTNPNNPVGKVLTRQDLSVLATLVDAHPSLWIVVDESYEAVQHEGRQHLAAWLDPALRDRSIIVRSFSKSFAVTWLRLGWLAGPTAVVQSVAKVIQWQQLYGSFLNQRVALAVLEGDRSWLSPAMEGFSHGRNLLYEQIAAIPGCRVHLPEAGPFLFPDISRARKKSSAIISDLHRHGISAIPGSYFAGSETCFRFPVGGDQETQLKAAEILAQVLSD